MPLWMGLHEILFRDPVSICDAVVDVSANKSLKV